MQRRDRGLQLVRTGRVHGEGEVQSANALGDHVPVPPRTILVIQQHQFAAVGRPRGVPGVLQQHERQQAERLGLAGHQRRQHAGEPDGLVAQLRADQRALGGGVALVEDQVQDGQHPIQPLGQQLGRRDAVGDGGSADLALGPYEPLLDRRLAHHEGARDLAAGETTHGPKRERHARVGRERRVTAGEDQPQAFVGDLAHLVAQSLQMGELAKGVGAFPQPPFSPQAVDRAVPGGRGDPRPRVVRQALGRPALQRHREGVLHRLLGQVEVTEHADERRDRPPRLAPEQAVDDLTARGGAIDRRPYMPMTGRTSMEPFSAPGHRAAASMAWSRFSASIR